MNIAKKSSNRAIWLLLVSISLILGCSEDNSVEPTLEELMVWPQTVNDTVPVGNSSVLSTIIKVDCNPHAVVSFSFSCGASWISLSNMEGTSYATTRDSFALRIDPSSLPIGTHVDSVTIVSSGAHNSPQYVEVTLEVEAIPPDLVVHPQWLTFSADSFDDVVESQDFDVTCADGSNLSYSLSQPASWVTLSGFDGATPDVISVTVNPVGLSTGSHIESITVSSSQMHDSPQTVVCQLEIPPWVVQEAPIAQRLQDVISLDGDRVWAAGFIANSDFREGLICRTLDGGRNWEASLILPAVSGQAFGFASIALAGENVWVVGESGVIYRSEDYGDSWQNVSSGLQDTVVTFNDIFFISSQIGWIVGENGIVLKTVDGGQTWSPRPTGTTDELHSVFFIDALNGWAVGSDKVLIRTSDGGETWEPHDCPFRDNRDVSFADLNHGWIVGKPDAVGTISYTSDGGLTWSTMATGVSNVWLQAVYFVDESTGWIVGQSGTMLHTDNGGQTWTVRESGTTGWLFGISFANDTDGWVVGGEGTILFTSSAGH